jgi:hypothetical protein
MAVKDKEVNKNVINIKIGDIEKKKKGKNKKRKIAQKAKPAGSFTYASSAPTMSQRPLHPQLPTTSSHYNRAQEANLSTLIGAEQELKQSKEREKTLNSIIDNRLYNSSNNSKNTPISRSKNTYISPIPMNSPNPFSPEKSDNSPFSLLQKEKSLNDVNMMMENNNKKADILLQKEPSPIHDNSLYLSSDKEDVNKSNQKVAHKKVTIEEPEPVKEKREARITLKALRQAIKDKGFPIYYNDEDGSIRYFTKRELLDRFNFIELEKNDKREHEKKSKRNENDDTHYVTNTFPSQNDISYIDTMLSHREENELNDLMSGMNLS